jgi:hypothetical protein
LTDTEKCIAVYEALRIYVTSQQPMAHLPDVVRQCELSGIERTLAYKVIDRYNNQLWRRIGSNIGFITIEGNNE